MLIGSKRLRPTVRSFGAAREPTEPMLGEICLA
jgi:hypothetical protein